MKKLKINKMVEAEGARGAGGAEGAGEAGEAEGAGGVGAHFHYYLFGYTHK